MYAVIETGGKQYRVEEGDTIFVEKMEANEGETISFDKVVAVSVDGELKVGAPLVEGATVSATVIRKAKGKKIMVFKYKAKKNERRRKGHRQPYTKVQIVSIQA